MGFTSRERRALIVLSLLFVILLVLNFFPEIFFQAKPIEDKYFDQAVEALKQRKQTTKENFSEVFGQPDPDAVYARSKLNPFPFDPNQLPEEEWLRLGLAGHQIKAIKNYEKKGGKFLRKEDLSKIYSLSDVEYKILEPFIRIDARYEKPEKRQSDSSQFKRERPGKHVFTGVIELNLADSLQLMQLQGIGPWTAHRILKYRERLGGFLLVSQLREIKGVDSALIVEIGHQLSADESMIHKLDINRAEFKQLLSHPYLDMALVKKIIQHRERRGRFSSWEEFMEVIAPDTKTVERLKHYAKF